MLDGNDHGCRISQMRFHNNCAPFYSLFPSLLFLLLFFSSFAGRGGRRGEVEKRAIGKNAPTLSTLISILGLMILYQRYIHHINHLLPSKLPVRQNGCVKEAEGVKYVSRVLRWVEGGDCVRRWMIWGISASG